MKARLEAPLNRVKQALVLLQKMVPIASSQVTHKELLCLLHGTSAHDQSVKLCRASRPWPWQQRARLSRSSNWLWGSSVSVHKIGRGGPQLGSL